MQNNNIKCDIHSQHKENMEGTFERVKPKQKFPINRKTTWHKILCARIKIETKKYVWLK